MTVFKRLITDAEEQEEYNFHRYAGWIFAWKKAVAENYRTTKYISIRIDNRQGYIGRFSFTNRTIPELDRSVISREEIKKEIARVYGMKELGPVMVRGGGMQKISPSDQVRDECLKMKVGYSMGRHLLWWEYREEKGGGARADSSVFDAVSGQLISSNVRNAEGERVENYTNRGYYPWDTREKIIERLEYLAKRRAVQLRNLRRQKEKERQAKQDAEQQKGLDQDGK